MCYSALQLRQKGHLLPFFEEKTETIDMGSDALWAISVTVIMTLKISWVTPNLKGS